MQRAVERSRSFLDQQADGITNLMAARVETVAANVRTLGRQLAEDDLTNATAGFVDQAAAFLDDVARYLRSADGQRLFDDAENLASRYPVLAAGAGFAAGVIVARFIKARE